MRYLIFLFLLSTVSFAQNVEEFLKSQQVIRVFAHDAPGFGLQTASQNTMTRLRHLGFKGKFEFVYSTRVADKIAILFDLPTPLPPILQDAPSKIDFITLAEFVKRHKNKENPIIALGISGGMDSGPCGVARDNDIDIFHQMQPLDCLNHANFMDTRVFVQLLTFFKYPNFLYKMDDANYQGYQHNNGIGKFNPIFPASLTTAKNYLHDNTRGKRFAKEHIAIDALIDGIEKQSFNLLSVYGITIESKCLKNTLSYRYPGCFPGNILQILAGARFAQLYGPRDYHKPLVILVYYNFAQEAKDIMTMLHHSQGNIQRMFVTLRMKTALSIGSLQETSTITKLTQLHDNEILLLYTGPLPHIIFDGLYHHTGKNIWPQVREGNNALASLLLSGKPHLRCGTKWELGDTFMSAEVKEKFNALYHDDGICRGMRSWENNPLLYENIGHFFIEAANANSALSNYFRKLKRWVLLPENDRLVCALEEAIGLMAQGEQ